MHTSTLAMEQIATTRSIFNWVLTAPISYPRPFTMVVALPISSPEHRALPGTTKWRTSLDSLTMLGRNLGLVRHLYTRSC